MCKSDAKVAQVHIVTARELKNSGNKAKLALQQIQMCPDDASAVCVQMTHDRNDT